MRTLCSSFATIVVAAILVTTPRVSIADVTLTGDFFTAFGDPPCCETTENLFVGTQGAPESGSLIVDGGSNLTQYYSMIFGIFEKTARGDMVVAAASSVVVGSDLAIGSTGKGSLTVSGGSTIDVLAGPIPFSASSFFLEPGCFSVGTFGGSNGSAVVTDAGSNIFSAECVVIGGGGSDAGGGNPLMPGRGSVDILNGAHLESLFLVIGLRQTGIGNVNVIDASLSLLGTDDSVPVPFGAFMNVGRTAPGDILGE